MKPCNDGAHHWIVEEARDGKRYLSGRCKKCKAVRHDFKASFDEDTKIWNSGELRRREMKRSEPFVYMDFDL